MQLRIVQSCPWATELTTRVDLVQVIPVCGHERGSDNGFVPRTVVVDGADTPSPTAAEDASFLDAEARLLVGATPPGAPTPAVTTAGAMSSESFEDYLDFVDTPSWPAPANPQAAWVDTANPGVVFLNSAFCGQSPSEPGAFDPAMLVLQLPTWVRASASGVLPLWVRQVASPNGEFNYGLAMDVRVRYPDDPWRSAYVSLQGTDLVQLTEGTYEVLPIVGEGGRGSSAPPTRHPRESV